MTVQIPAIELERLRRLRAEWTAAESGVRAATAERDMARYRFEVAARSCVASVAPDAQQPAIDLTSGQIVDEGE